MWGLANEFHYPQTFWVLRELAREFPSEYAQPVLCTDGQIWRGTNTKRSKQAIWLDSGLVVKFAFLCTGFRHFSECRVKGRRGFFRVQYFTKAG